MAIALIIGRDEQDRKRFSYFLENIPGLLSSLQAGLDIRCYPNLGDYNDIDFAIAWRAPLGVFKKFPNLKCIASLAAGVDHLLADPNLPADVPIVRIIDPSMSIEITQYVVVTVLNWLRRFEHWQTLQSKKQWGKSPPFHFLDKTVGILGLGFLGKNAANALASLGVKVIGWSNSPKNLAEIPHFTGAAELKSFLTKTDVLVCMLPLTPHTRNILNAENFAYLPQGAYLINLGRGDHLVEADLLTALASGQLAGACLDVFREEPPPSNHPFWDHPQIRITPHIASVTNPVTALPQILENYRNAMAGKPLLNRVDPHKGY